MDGFATQPALPDQTGRGLPEQTVFVTTVRRELPNCIEMIDAPPRDESSRLLPEDAADAA